MKVVINRCYGGFGLSVKAQQWLWEHGYQDETFGRPVEEFFSDGVHGQSKKDRLPQELREWRDYKQGLVGDCGPRYEPLFAFTEDEKHVLTRYPHRMPRNHPLLVQCVEELGEAANGPNAKLKIVEVPDGVQFEIGDYDGQEAVEEVHRSWY